MKYRIVLLLIAIFTAVCWTSAAIGATHNNADAFLVAVDTISPGSVTFVVERTNATNAKSYVENVCYSDTLGGIAVLDNRVDIVWDPAAVNTIGSAGPTPTAGIVCEADYKVSNKVVASYVYTPVS